MFRDRIRNAYKDLSPSFLRLADFLTDHPYEAAFMTATQLGRRLDVDTATVVRFAQRLDYPGFPELLDEVQDEVRAQLLRYFQPSDATASQLDTYHAAVRHDLQNLEQFDLMLDTKAIERLVAMIQKAHLIYVVGDGMLSRPLAGLLADGLRALTFNAVDLALDAATIASEFLNLSGDDLVIAFGVTHYGPDATSIVEFARERGAMTFAFAGASSWPIARSAEVSVICPYTSITKGSSIAVFGVAIDALLNTLFVNRRPKILESFVNFEQAMHRLTESRGQYRFVRPDWASPNGNDSGR